MPPTISWYRSPISAEEKKRLHCRSDVLGFLQAGGHAAIMIATGLIACWLAATGHWWLFAGALFLHGMVCAFAVNAVHELVHGTVFRTRWLNDAWACFFAFIGWHNHYLFWRSHTEHHRYTLHDPSDREVVLPIKYAVRDFLLTGFINPKGVYEALSNTVRMACGKFDPGWESDILPDDASGTKARRRVIGWARLLLVLHGSIALVCLALGYWFIPVVLSCSMVAGGGLFFLCNNTQHIGLVDQVPDYRLCCRTFQLHPVVRFLYWHMNFHTEHHMYASVPCYRLGELHQLIAADLPVSQVGLHATWREIFEIQKRQESEPEYQHYQTLPATATPAKLGP